MTKSEFTITILFVFFLIFNLSAQNPIIQDIGMSDPHVRVFNDTLYLYTGHDSSPEDKTWVMKDWRVFRTTDLNNWKQVGTISPKENYMDDNSTDCWASDAMQRNGKYYFYFSDRKRGIGVMSAERPEGPFKDALGKPLVSPMHDPSIFIEDNTDKTPYLFYGDKEGGGFHVAPLNKDMISLAEQPKPIEIIGEEWEKAPAWMDKNYIFKYNNKYYLSWGRDYAIAENIYGPYKCMGAVGTGFNLNEYAHGSFFWWKGQFYHVWCYYIKNGFKYRETIISYCHFDNDGKIVTDTNFLDKHFKNGVGQYKTSWDKIEAEWYYEISRGIEKRGSRENGFILTNVTNENYIRFANVEFNGSEKQLEVFLKSTGNGKIEIYIDKVKGEKIGQINVSNNLSYKSISAEIKTVNGRHDLFLKFKAKPQNKISVDWLRFN